MGKTGWNVDEFGCILPIIAVVFAVYFWSRRRELPALPRSKDVSVFVSDCFSHFEGWPEAEAALEPATVAG